MSDGKTQLCQRIRSAAVVDHQAPNPKNRLWWRRLLCSLSICVCFTSCSHNEAQKSGESAKESPSPASPSGRYAGKEQDWGPETEIDMSHVPDAIPRYEPRTLSGNKNPYTVFGQTYYLMDDERAYKERGKASWYGYKFNGENTSNGERYDMFAMTGAHKSLPIPSYVRVTNLANQKSVIVRINDRGPFHENRIIDLSYAAAQRLGITRLGTGDVEVEIVLPQEDPRPPLKPLSKGQITKEPTKASSALGMVSKTEAGIVGKDTKMPEGTYLQIAAFTSQASAQQFATSVGAKLLYPVVINEANSAQKLYRVRVGPFKDTQGIEAAREQLQKIQILQAHIVYH